MYFCLIVTLLVSGVAMSWLAASRPSLRPFAAAAMEKASGALLVAAFWMGKRLTAMPVVDPVPPGETTPDRPETVSTEPAAVEPDDGEEGPSP